MQEGYFSKQRTFHAPLHEKTTGFYAGNPGLLPLPNTRVAMSGTCRTK